MEFFGNNNGAGYVDPEDSDFESFMMAQFQAKLHFFWQPMAVTNPSSNHHEDCEETTVIVSSHRLCSMLIQDYLFTLGRTATDNDGSTSNNTNGGWQEIAKIVGQTMTQEISPGQSTTITLVPTDGVKTHYFTVYSRRYRNNDTGMLCRLLWIKPVKEFAFVREHWSSLVECLLLDRHSSSASSSSSIVKEMIILHVHQDSPGMPMMADEVEEFNERTDIEATKTFKYLPKSTENLLNESSSSMGSFIHGFHQSLLPTLPSWSTSRSVASTLRYLPPHSPVTATLMEPIKSLVETCDERSIPTVLFILPFNKYDLSPTKLAIEQIVRSLVDVINFVKLPTNSNSIDLEIEAELKQSYDRWKRLVHASSSHLYM